jgi:Cu(I)/Ag(I) efflux system membrane fusion protein
MKKSILFLLFFTLIFTACSKSAEYKLRPPKATEIGIQAICPVTNNVFNVDKETKAVDYKGKTYFLCCPDCSVDFQKKLGLMVSHKDHDNMQGMKGMDDNKKNAGEKEIIYWTCPMHPQVKEKGPGQCPICSMTLVPVYKKEGNRIAVDQSTGKLLGLKSETAKVMQVNKIVHLPARVAYDNDLYLSQQEYILSYKNFSSGQNDILDGAKFRLKLLGYTDNDIKELEKQTQPDKTLLYPGDKAWLFADVYENDLEAVKPGKEVAAVTDTFPSTKFSGLVMFIEPSLNPETRSAKARILVNNTGNLLKLEMFANIEVKTSKSSVLAVPKTAVIDTGLRKVVYIDYANGEYEPKDVKTGFTGDDYIEIKSGLKAGDLVVTNGNFMLDSESQLKSGSASNGMEGMDMSGKK